MAGHPSNSSGKNTWTEPQTRALAFEGNLCILAGAGSGKTLTLVELVRRLLAGDVLDQRLDITQILALTYTEKAAREMRDRIRLSLNRHIKTASPDDRTFWIRQRRLLDRAQISTIHSFCLQVLRQYGLEAGQDPDFAIMDDEREFRAETIRETILDWIQEEDPDLLYLLDYYPWMGRGRMIGLDQILTMISGRTRLAGRRISLDPPEGLTMAPAVDALYRAAQTITALVDGGKLKPGKKYYDLATAFAAAVWEKAGPGKTEDEILSAAPELAAMLIGNWYAGKPAKDMAEEALNDLMGEWLRRQSIPLKEKLYALSQRLDHALTQAKEQHLALDFDDLLLKTRNILAERPDIRARLKEHFRVVLVDEFQDTNRLQADIMAYLTEPADQNQPVDPETPVSETVDRAPRRLVVLGDPKQSIYRFRGAEVGVFNAIRDAIDREQDHQGVIALDTNFRSQKRLVNFFNAFFEFLMPPGQLPNTSFGPHDRQHSHRPDQGPGPAAWVLDVPKGDTAAQSRVLEAEALARYLARIFSGDIEVLVGEEGRPAGPGDVAVLLRRFTHLKGYEQAFRKWGLPYYTLRGKGFYQCQEVLDLINFLGYLADLNQGPALLGVLRSPLFGLSDDTLTRLAWPADVSTTADLAAWFAEDPPPRPQGLDREQTRALETAQTIIRDLRRQAGYIYPADLVEELIEKTDYLSVLAAGFQGEQKVANVQRFIEVTRRLPIRALYSPGEMSRYFQNKLRDLQGDPEAQVSAEGAGAIQIMTIHQAKGLQFPVVLVPDAGSMPRLENRNVIFDATDHLAIRVRDLETQKNEVPLDYRRIKAESDQLDWAEHYRLLYVAATRAQDHLVFSGSPEEAKNGNWLDKLTEFSDNHPEWIGRIPLVEATDTGPEVPLALLDQAPGVQNAFLFQEEASQPVNPTASGVIQRVLKPKVSRPAFFNLNVTGLAQYLACPRRYYLETIAGLPEMSGKRQDDPEKEPAQGLPARERGIVLHHLLETMDLAVPVDRGRLGETARNRAEEEGRIIDAAYADRLAGLALEFLDSPWGREAQAAARHGGLIQRECPLWLRIDLDNPERSQMVLTGEIDLFFIPETGPARIVDYKYAHPKEAGRYEAQLKTYALALVRAGLTRHLQAGLYFTGQSGAHEVEIPLEDGWMEAFESQLKQTGLDILDLFGTEGAGPDPNPDCPGESCGYHYACR